MIVISAPFAATVARLAVAVGDEVAAGTVVAVLESMKIEHPITTPDSGVVTEVAVDVGDAMADGDVVMTLEPAEVSAPHPAVDTAPDLDEVRPDLAAVLDRQAGLADDARPEAVAKRHALGRRTARENLADLCDEGSFEEYGGLVVAAQAARRTGTAPNSR